MPTIFVRLPAIAALLLASLACSDAAWAARAGGATADPVLVAGQRLVVPSKVLGEQREILVHLPRDYAKSQQRYPVLYLLDGNNHFMYASGMLEFFARNGRAPELILVAVPTLQKRSRDLTMPMTLDKEAIERRKPYEQVGGAGDFLRFLADELSPWVDAHYRTAPYRILSGHSLGGLFNFYALLERPDAFQAHIAVSPSLWWDQRAWVKQAEERLASLPGRHWLYFSWGDDEVSIRDSSQELVDWMRKQPLPELEWRHRYYPGDDHGTTPLRTLYDGLEWLYAGWQLKVHEPKKLEYAELQRRIGDHYAELSQRYGYAIEPGLEARQALTDWLVGRERYDEALAEAQANLVAHPYASWLNETISKILDKQGKPQEALAAYKRSLPQTNEYGNVWESQHRLQELTGKAAGRGDTRPAADQ